ncbi:hypothetical protein [Siccirubricoccus phaeus]|uniref:hypothetical protein n=1 Tax=Siccirubricoccus phaeus TaxID=2595053 RepID=UPI0011F297C1|nr:hypothetical protein [Siccirubricoccus phaeus]
MSIRPILLAAGLALSGCGAVQQPPLGYASLPSDAVVGAGDPTRAAIISTASAFADPSRLAGQPAVAARAVANYEYLTTELPYGARWREFSPLVGPELVRGQQEMRPAVGIAPNAPVQPVVDSLYAASRALQAGDRAAAERILSNPIFPAGGEATLQRLAALPPLPQANAAAALAAQELRRKDSDPGDRGGGQGGEGGRS